MSTLFILLFIFLMKFMLEILFTYYAFNASDRIHPEARVDRATSYVDEVLLSTQVEGLIDGSSFDDQFRDLMKQMTQIAQDDAFLIDGEVAETRLKREISREKRNCNMSVNQCEELLQSVQSYLEFFNVSAFDKKNISLYDIMTCLKCKNQKPEFKQETPLPNDPASPHDYVQGDHSNDSFQSNGTSFKIPDKQKIKSDPGVDFAGSNDRAGAVKMQAASVKFTTKITPLRVATSESPKDENKITLALDTSFGTKLHANDVDRNLTPTVDNKQSVGDPVANPPPTHQTQHQSPPSSLITKIDEHRTTAGSSTDESSVATLRLTAMKVSTETTYSASEHNSTSKGVTTVTHSTKSNEASTPSLGIYFTKQNAITENVTSEPAGHNVTGMGDPSVHPSLEGHPENRSAAAVDELKFMMRLVFDNFTLANDRKKEDAEPSQLFQSTATSANSNEKAQLIPVLPLSMICFHDFSDQSSSKQSSLGSTSFYPNFLTPSNPRYPQPPFQDPSSSYQGAGSSEPNYAQAKSVESTPLNYVGNLAQGQPTVPGFGPTGPASQNIIFSMNQQPTGSSPNKPYFCTYVPTLLLPFNGTMQVSRSTDERTQELPKNPPKSPNGKQTSQYKRLHPWDTCPSNYRMCVQDEYCITKTKWCDGRIDCVDASDEISCSCRDRISQDRICDGYFDCLQGEDEIGCYNCPSDSFSCNDWDNHASHTCVPFSQRCDEIEQCRNGKDELDCDILSLSPLNEKNIFEVGYTKGFLHKNIQGEWYPVCVNNDDLWAIKACTSEAGQVLTSKPDVQTVQVSPNTFQGPYVVFSNNKTQFVSSCWNNIFVTCPPLQCGTRVLHPNSFLVFNPRNSDVNRKYVEERAISDAAKFSELYWQTLGLLDDNYSDIEMKQQDYNDTFVGAQLRVVGGRTSQPKAWPFMVAIYKDGDFHCGGVIVNSTRILTAAHCMDRYKAHYYEVQAGILRRLSFSPMAQLRKVTHVIIHTSYYSREMQNDIAILILNEPLLFNRWVRQSCLPSADTAGSEWQKSPMPHSTCIAIGWGALRERGPDPDHLREVEVPILSSCKYIVDQNNATICAGYSQGGRDACQGDSGGPLMCRNPNLESQWYVAGIISHGDGCGRPDEPGVYTRVSHFVTWIQKIFEKLPNFSYENTPLDECPGFSCVTGLRRCLPLHKHCDLIADCLDAEDETYCTSYIYNAIRYSQSNSSDKYVELNLEPSDGESNDIAENRTITETVPVSTLYETQNDNHESLNTESPDTTAFKITPRITFTCTKLIQTITIVKRCDRRLDCEDGSDEENCTCRDFLSNLRPRAICDGHLDCDDETDEENCDTCGESEFLCSRSDKCIPLASRCNGIFDCPLREDETDCIALTNGEYVSVDNDNRPVLHIEGLLSRYTNGTWRVECPQSSVRNDTVMTEIGENTCEYLGFANLQSVDRVAVNKRQLETKSWRKRNNTTGYDGLPPSRVAASAKATCLALRIRCRPVLSGSSEAYLLSVVDPRTGNRAYQWPWLAAIFIDGRYRCSALLLESDWLLSDSWCTEDIKLSVNYTTALLGQSRSYFHVDGPNQQISVVDAIKDVKGVSLLHLKTAVNLTRYVLPLFLEKKIYPAEKSDLCVTIGTDQEHTTQSIFLQPVSQNCDKCHRCFVETSKCSTNGASLDWSGMIFCRSQKGWYPAAVFHKDNSPCSFQEMQNLTSFDYIHAYLTQAIEEKLQPVAEPTCDGVRCKIGQCIPWNRVCDGVMDCRDGADEKNEMCAEIYYHYKITQNKVSGKCSRSELRCGNGQCVSKSVFCDGKVDCLDGTDEPVKCTCAEYLKLTASGRLCDGVQHCFDKTDESPEVCHCTENSFKCDAKSKNSICISRDFVCDGDEDCPNGEDEKLCKKLKEFAQDRPDAGEVVERSFGLWHSRCYSEPMVSQEKAKIACEEIGYAGGSIDKGNRTLSVPALLSRDDFYMIRLNPETWIIMRDDKPLATLVPPEKPCYRLFVECHK